MQTHSSESGVSRGGHIDLTRLGVVLLVVVAMLSGALLPVVSTLGYPSASTSGVASAGTASSSLPLAAAPATASLSPAPLPAATAPPASTSGAGSSFAFPSNFHLPSPLSHASPIASLSGRSLPPGMIYPSSPGLAASGWGGNNSWGNTTPVRFCDGIWPSVGGQGAYAGGASCYGHDEPGVDFYSPIVGSGGNVTWNVTLPVDRSPTQNQSDLYSAIWFGMTLTDPYAWMNACFLELQFYPDSSWYAPGSYSPNDTVYGQWVGEAVAWQIQASTGLEDPCFITPLFAHGVYGPNMFNMTQGDRISITMSGWTNDPYGENISVQDLTNGNSTTVNLFNRTGNYAYYYLPNNNYIQGHPNYPLDPSYPANNVENSLAWTPGGEFPVSFAFETGHGGNPTVPATNPYGGCSPGVPPNNPSTPCPSYDPGSWTNDTAQPWEIAPPTFFNATARSASAQVGFHQDTGASGFIDNSTGSAVTTACIGGYPSAWCDYPWYSYSCSEGAFNFGATDYAATSQDFGQGNEYNLNFTHDSAGLGYYAPQNFSVPTCGAPSYSVTIGSDPGGGVYFLHSRFTANSSAPGLGTGYYSLHAIARAGSVFTGWLVSGSLTVGDARSPYTSLDVQGGGSVYARFSATGTNVTLTYRSTPTTGHISIVRGTYFGPITGSVEANGATQGLGEGRYSLLALPPSGYNFSSWSISGAAAAITSPALPFTTLIVSAGGGSVTLTANFVASSVTVAALVEDYIGSGSVTFDGQTNPLSPITVPVGGYAITATPAAGWQFVEWAYTASVEIIDLHNAVTGFVAQQAPIEVVVGAVFAPAVTFDDSPASAGSVAVGSLGLFPAPSGSTLYMSPGTYTIVAAPNSGETFQHWSASSATAVWVEQPTQAIATMLVNTSATVTATYATSPSVTQLWLNDTPAAGGRIFFNYVSYGSGQSNSTVGGGLFTVFAVPNPGYAFSKWTFGGDVVQAGTNVISVSPLLGYGSVTATFTAGVVPVTYVGPVSATISTTTVTSDHSAYVNPGSYVLTANLPTNTTFIDWRTQGDVVVGNATSATTSIVVNGPGVVWATENGTKFAVGPISMTPSGPITVGDHLGFSVSVTSGPGPFSYRWSAPAGWCPTLTNGSIACSALTTGNYTVSVTVEDALGEAILPAPLTLRVLPTFTVQSVYVSYDRLTLGASLAISTSLLGGVSPAVVSYSGLPGCSATNTTGTLTCSPTTVGNFVLVATATDAAGQVASSNRTITVYPTLLVTSFTVAPAAAVTLGTIVGLNVTFTGGTSPYTFRYSGLPTGPGCSSANTTALSCLPTLAGSYNVTVVVTDSGGGAATRYVTLLVNPVPSISSFGVNPSTVSLGGSVELSVTANGGTLPLSFAYTGLPSGCASQNAPTLNCTSSITGTFTTTVTVTDADGKVATQSVTFTVSPAPPTSSESGLTGLDLALIGIVVVAIAALLVAIILLRRRRGPGAAAASPPPSSPAPPSASGVATDQPYIYGQEPPRGDR